MVWTWIVAALTVIASWFLVVFVGFAIESDELRSNPHYSQQHLQATRAAASVAFRVFIILALSSATLLARGARFQWKVHGAVRWLAAFGAVLLATYAMSCVWLTGVASGPVRWLSDLLR